MAKVTIEDQIEAVESAISWSVAHLSQKTLDNANAGLETLRFMQKYQVQIRPVFASVAKNFPVDQKADARVS